MQPYGGFWLRLVAYLIDGVILNIAGWALGMVFGLAISLGGIGEDAAMGGVFALSGFSLVTGWLYSAVLESSQWQATVGKKALSLVVTDEEGQRIGFGRATARYFAKILSMLILFFGFIMIGWTRRKQGLHDMIAGTLVYKASSPDLVRNTADVFN